MGNKAIYTQPKGRNSFRRISGFIVLLIFAAAFVSIWANIISRALNPKPAVQPLQQPPVHYAEKVYTPTPQQPQPAEPSVPIRTLIQGLQKPANPETEVVESPPKTYSGYIEMNGKRFEVYNPASTTSTFAFTTRGNIKYLTVEIDNRFIEFLIDTGCSDVTLNAESMQRLGIKNFTRKAIHGTAGGPIEAYHFIIPSIKLGRFEVRNVEASYSPRNVYNLLGNTFLSHFNVTINESKGEIMLTQK